MKRIAALTLSAALLVLGAVGLSMPASAAGLSQHVQVTGYDPNVDYTAAIQRTLEDGSAYAMQVGAIYEEPAYTEEDLDLLSRVIYAEVGCTWIPDWVQRMVGSVVLNRVNSPYYPDTIYDVIYQPGQYAPTWDGSIHKTPDARTIENARYLLEHGSICPENVVGQNSIVTGSGVYTSYQDPILGTTVYFCYL